MRVNVFIQNIEQQKITMQIEIKLPGPEFLAIALIFTKLKLIFVLIAAVQTKIEDMVCQNCIPLIYIYIIFCLIGTLYILISQH